MSISRKIHFLFNTPMKGKQIYYFAFSFYFILAFLQTTTYIEYINENFIQKLFLFSLILVLIKIFIYDDNSLKLLLINILALSILIIVWRFSHDVKFFSMGIFVLGARNVNYKKIIYLYLSIGLIFLAFTICSALTGLIKNLVYYRGSTNIARQSLGIIYPTDFAAHVLFLFLAYLYLKFDKLNIFDYLFLISVAIVLIIINNARLNAYALILAVPVFFWGNRARKRKIISSFIADLYWTIPIILAYLIVILTIFYNKSNYYLAKFNKLLSNRLEYGSIAFKKYRISIFGQHVQEYGWGGLNGKIMTNHASNNYFFIDSSFIRLVIIYGIIITIFVLLIMTAISYLSIYKGSYAMASVMVIVALSAAVEQHLLDLSYDPFLIAFLANTALPLTEKRRKN